MEMNLTITEEKMLKFKPLSKKQLGIQLVLLTQLKTKRRPYNRTIFYLREKVSTNINNNRNCLVIHFAKFCIIIST